MIKGRSQCGRKAEQSRSPLFIKYPALPLTLSQTRLIFSLPLSVYLGSYSKNYDANQWFMQGAKVWKLQSFAEQSMGEILSLSVCTRSSRFFSDSEMSCCVIRSIFEPEQNKAIVLMKNLEFESFLAPPKPTINHLFVKLKVFS